MARLLATRKLRQRKKMVALLLLWLEILDMVDLFFQLICYVTRYYVERYTLKKTYSLFQHVRTRTSYLNGLLRDSDRKCIDHLRMDRHTFSRPCWMLRTFGGLNDSRYVSLEEQVALFLNIVAPHKKIRIVQDDFKRTGWTISENFNKVLIGVLRLGDMLLKRPEPVLENSKDDRWKWFKDCIGALDGTHIKVRVPEEDKPKYRNRKGEISTNVIAACSQDMQFIYVLAGWEGSAADARVLPDAVTRRNGLKVPHGQYFLVDAGFTNCEGFLAPYRGQRYHLNEWKSGYQPQNHTELFNMKHSSARNIIERCFGVLKMRWAILRSPSFYPIRTENRIIMACCLLHNLIRREMAVDPMEELYDRCRIVRHRRDDDYIDTIETTEEWKLKRDQMAKDMFRKWRASKRR